MTPIYSLSKSQRGVTLIEVVVATLLFAIFIAGIGFLSKTIIPTQRAVRANTVQLDAIRLHERLVRDIQNADVVTVPTQPTDDNEIISSTFLDMQVLTPNPAGGAPIRRFVSYKIQGNEILYCQGAAGGAICAPTDNLLSSWDNGQVKAENGTRFIRGIDADNDGTLSKREWQMIRVELVLSQNEGPYGQDEKVYEKVYFLEILSNVNNSRSI